VIPFAIYLGKPFLALESFAIFPMLRQGLVGSKVLLICRDPVGRDFPLCLAQVQIAAANQIPKMAFQGVFDACISDCGRIRMGPEIPNVVRAA